jgi:ornithine cyclodeaminase
VQVLTHSDLERLLPFDVCIEEMRRAMRATSHRECVLPLRQFMPVPGHPGKLGLMPGYIGGDGECFGVKIVSKFERAADDPHGSHVGVVLLFDATTGLPLGLLEGGTLTAIRTASTTALATDVLARADAKRLLIVGTGEEAWYHARALAHVRAFESIGVWGRNPAHAAKLVARLAAAKLPHAPTVVAVDDLATAFAAADVACTVTSAKEPFVNGAWLPPGLHLNLVGSAIPTTAEVDVETVRRGKFFVDYRDAALAQAGELRNAIAAGVVDADHVAGEIGEVLNGDRAGRGTDREITIYKSLGVTTQDLAAGLRALREAERLNLGRTLDLGA